MKFRSKHPMKDLCGHQQDHGHVPTELESNPVTELDQGAAIALQRLGTTLSEATSLERSALDALLALSDRRCRCVDIGIQVCTDSSPARRNTSVDLLSTDAAIKAFTGVETAELLMYLSEAVAKLDALSTECSVLERVILVLVRLKTFLSFKCLAVLFAISEATVHRYFYGTVRPLAAVLEAAVPWPTAEEIKKNQPHCFAAFGDVRVVLDCTEVEVEKSHCASCRILTYSHYKGVHTVKVLIGVSPGALITFVSDTFSGRASDKACVNVSGVLDQLQPFEDDLMVDKGFNIDDRCTELGVGVIQPPFLRKQTQFSQEGAMKTVQIARARVHVERAIQRMKLFRISKGPLPWEMLAVADEVFIIIAGMVNLSAPILAEKRFQLFKA
nr:uncharacterized protein LOC129382037 [Dermacentor andersoni]